MDGLGDKTPSQCMTMMLNLLPAGEEPGFLFREHFLRQLPTDIRTQLVQSTRTGTGQADLRALATEDDNYFLSMGSRISAVAVAVGYMIKTHIGLSTMVLGTALIKYHGNPD